MTLLLEKETGVTDHRTTNTAIRYPEPSPDIVDYYRQTIEDYQTWSLDGYMHFGLWKPGINPLNRKRMLEAMNDLVFDSLRLNEDRCLKIADLGCGVGAVSRYGSRRHISHHWYAVTISPEQVAWGRSRLDPLDEERMNILQANFCDLPFEDESLDAAFFLESLCHADRPEDALMEATRVLKPGGRLVVVDGMMRNEPEETPPLVNRLSRKTAESWAVGQFHSVPGFQAAVRQCELIVESQEEIGWRLAPCVAHSPFLIGGHALRLLATGKLNEWKRKHLIGCTLGVLLGMMRNHFGYYIWSLQRSE